MRIPTSFTIGMLTVLLQNPKFGPGFPVSNVFTVSLMLAVYGRGSLSSFSSVAQIRLKS